MKLIKHLQLPYLHNNNNNNKLLKTECGFFKNKFISKLSFSPFYCKNMKEQIEINRNQYVQNQFNKYIQNKEKNQADNNNKNNTQKHVLNTESFDSLIHFKNTLYNQFKLKCKKKDSNNNNCPIKVKALNKLYQCKLDNQQKKFGYILNQNIY